MSLHRPNTLYPAKTTYSVSLRQVLRDHDHMSRLRVSTLPLVVEAFCEHGRAGEVVAMFEEQLAVVSDRVIPVGMVHFSRLFSAGRWRLRFLRRTWCSFRQKQSVDASRPTRITWKRVWSLECVRVRENTVNACQVQAVYFDLWFQ